MGPSPRFDYARAGHEVTLTEHGALFRSPGVHLSLSTRCPLEIVDRGDVRTRTELLAGETATFALGRRQRGETPVRCSDAGFTAEVDGTVRSGSGRNRWTSPGRPTPVTR